MFESSTIKLGLELGREDMQSLKHQIKEQIWGLK